jgi:hypothetical protein
VKHGANAARRARRVQGRASTAGYGRPAATRADQFNFLSWQDAGPIIEREWINVSYDDQGGMERGQWLAYVYEGDEVRCGWLTRL